MATDNKKCELDFNKNKQKCLKMFTKTVSPGVKHVELVMCNIIASMKYEKCLGFDVLL